MTFGEKIKQARTAKKLPRSNLQKKSMQNIIQLVTGKKISAGQIWTLSSFYVAFWK